MSVTQLALDSINTWRQNRSAYAFSEKLDLADLACSLLELSAKQCGLERPFYFRVIQGTDKPFLLYDGMAPDFERLSNAVKQVASDLLLFWKPKNHDEIPTNDLRKVYERYTKASAFAIGYWGIESSNFSLLEKAAHYQKNVHVILNGEIYLIGETDAVNKTIDVFKSLFQLE